MWKGFWKKSNFRVIYRSESSTWLPMVWSFAVSKQGHFFLSGDSVQRASNCLQGPFSRGSSGTSYIQLLNLYVQHDDNKAVYFVCVPRYNGPILQFTSPMQSQTYSFCSPCWTWCFFLQVGVQQLRGWRAVWGDHARQRRHVLRAVRSQRTGEWRLVRLLGLGLQAMNRGCRGCRNVGVLWKFGVQWRDS